MTHNLLQKHRRITKYDFLGYFKNPYCLWFLNIEEIKEFLYDCELDFENIFEAIKELSNPDSVISTNAFELRNLKNKKLIDFYKIFFSIPTLSIWDFSSINEDASFQIEEILKNNELAFIFMPLLSSSILQIRPTALYKYKNSVYLIEHVWSSYLKKETIGVFAFYDFFFKQYSSIKVDQYLISYLSESSISFSNSLPFSIQKSKPTGFVDKKLKNINSYFGLPKDYRFSLYEKICSEEEYENLNNDDWDFSVDLEKPIKELELFMRNPERELFFSKLSSDFFKTTDWIKPDSKAYRFLLKNKCKFSVASILIPFPKVMSDLNLLAEIQNKDFYNFQEDQDYLVYEDAIKSFKKELKSKKIKIYYDFETMSLPFPIIPNSKPYQPIVFQMSLVKLEDGKESEVVNLINDPLNISVEDFRNIVDNLYSNQPDTAYLVYNKSFEISRLREMSLLIDDEDYSLKIVEIIDRTIDLGDYFKLGKKPRLVLKKLRGFWSIKEVSKLIPENILKASKTVNYGDLECQNGLMASQLFLYRWLHKCNFRVWNSIKDMLVKYCENDVRSMIAVEMFIEKLILENKYSLRASS